MARSNIRRLAPSEWRLVLALLDQDHDDVEELAKNIVRAINNKRAEEPIFVRAVREGTGVVLYGTYRTAEEARSDHLSGGTMHGGPDGVRVYSLIPPWGQGFAEMERENDGTNG